MDDCRHDVGRAVGARPEDLCDPEGPTLARHHLELSFTVLGHKHSPVLAVAIVANLVHVEDLNGGWGRLLEDLSQVKVCVRVPQLPEHLLCERCGSGACPLLGESARLREPGLTQQVCDPFLVVAKPVLANLGFLKPLRCLRVRDT